MHGCKKESRDQISRQYESRRYKPVILESRLNWISSRLNSVLLESRQNSIPSNTNPAKSESRQNWIPSTMNPVLIISRQKLNEQKFWGFLYMVRFWDTDLNPVKTECRQFWISPQKNMITIELNVDIVFKHHQKCIPPKRDYLGTKRFSTLWQSTYFWHTLAKDKFFQKCNFFFQFQ